MQRTMSTGKQYRNSTRRYRARFCLLLIIALTSIGAQAQTNSVQTPERVGVEGANAWLTKIRAQ